MEECNDIRANREIYTGTKEETLAERVIAGQADSEIEGGKCDKITEKTGGGQASGNTAKHVKRHAPTERS